MFSVVIMVLCLCLCCFKSPNILEIYIKELIDEMIFSISFLKRFYLFIFRQWRREGEREGEKHQCTVGSCVPPNGDLACNSGMCPDWESNWRPFGSQACPQSTEPHYPGLVFVLK